MELPTGEIRHRHAVLSINTTEHKEREGRRMNYVCSHPIMDGCSHLSILVVCGARVMTLHMFTETLLAMWPPAAGWVLPSGGPRHSNKIFVNLPRLYSLPSINVNPPEWIKVNIYRGVTFINISNYEESL